MYLFIGSAKAMEQDMVVEMVRDCLQTKGIRTSTIIGDDDSTTIPRLRHEIDPNIEKRSDRNSCQPSLHSSNDS